MFFANSLFMLINKFCENKNITTNNKNLCKSTSCLLGAPRKHGQYLQIPSILNFKGTSKLCWSNLTEMHCVAAV